MRTDAPVFADATFVFDLDGTIADTAPDLIEAANTALTSLGFAPAPAYAIKRGVGYGTRAMLKAGLEALGEKVDEDQLALLAGYLISHYDAHIAVKTKLFDGFLDTAHVLKEKGARLCLCTNKPERLTHKLLHALDIAAVFDGIAGGDTFVYRKPDPRHITGLLGETRRPLSRTLMIGDSEADIEAAKAASIKNVAVAFGYAKDGAEALFADAVLADYKELPALALELFEK